MVGRLLVFLALGVLGLAFRAEAQPSQGFAHENFLGRTYYLQVEAAPDSRHVAVLTSKYNFAADRKEWTIWNLRLSETGSKTDLKAVTTSDGEISALKWSSDGRYLAYKIKRASSPAGLSVFDVSTAKVREIPTQKTSNNGVSALSWSGDGRQLYFAVDDTPSLPKNAPVTFPRAEEPDPHSTYYQIPATDFGKREPKLLVAVDDFAPAEFALLAGESKIAVRGGSAIWLYDIRDPKAEKRLTPWFGCILEMRPVAKGLLFQACAGPPDGNLALNAVTVRTQRRQYIVDPVSGRTEQLAKDYDGELWARGVTSTGELLAIGLKSTKWTLYRIDPGTKRVEPIDMPASVVSHISVAGNGKLVAFATASDGEIYLAKDLGHLASAQKATDFNSAFNAVPRGESRTLSWSNGEGDEVEGVLYLPPGKTDAKGLPAVVLIHGGPWMARSVPYYAPLAGGPVDEALLLASRGYLVLAPNYRGSPGRGNTFLSALDGYPCSRPAADIMRGVDLIVSQGWADAARLGVMGGSYGGFLTNCIIGRTTRFKAAVTVASGWNFTSSYTDSPGSFVGGAKAPWDDMRLYWDEAPISRAGNIKTPTLIIHGEADTTVNPSQAREMNRALNRLRVPHELLMFPGEGHGFRTPSNDVTQWGARLSWFDHYLLGKPLPVAKVATPIRSGGNSEATSRGKP